MKKKYLQLNEIVTNEDYNHIFTELQKIPKEVSSLIKFTNEGLTI